MNAPLKIIIATLAATAALASCTKEITHPNFENDKVAPASEGSRVISVSFAPQTKTYLGSDGLQPKFNDKDSILISNGEAIDTCEVDVNGDNATISTNLTGPLTAVYPYKAAKMNESNLNQIDTVLVSTVQSGKFADANICMARMLDGKKESLSFENKTALLRFYVGESIGVKSIEISSGEDIAVDAGGLKKTITVDAGEQNTLDKVTDDPGKRICYVAVKPGVNAKSLCFTSATTSQDGQKVVRQSPSAATLEMGKMYNAFIPYYVNVKVSDNPEVYQKWAYCNVGAFLPEDSGDYFAWGETQRHKTNATWTAFEDGHDFSWATCPFNGNNPVYNEASFSAVKDEKCPNGLLAPDYDAATANWGDGWRMPMKNEFDQLLSSTGTTASGFADGVLSINGTDLKFPAAGSGSGKLPVSLGSSGRYWTLSLNTNNPSGAFSLSFKNGEVNTSEDSRYYGLSVRPVFGELPPAPEPVILSENGCANCYIVTGAGIYSFDATVKGSSTESVGSPSSASVVWKSFGTDKTPADGDLVYDVQFTDNQVHFSATGQKGNVVIAVKDGDNILWSWHIWLTDAPEDQTYVNDAGTMMDRNLGATSTSGAGALGLLYQWGRKDPFPGSSTVFPSTLAAYTLFSWPCISAPQTPEWSVAHPETFIKGTSAANNDWTTTDDNLWAGTKTEYDPCPAGYRVPDGGDNGIWGKAGFDTAGRSVWNYGYGFYVLEGEGTAWYPSPGRIEDTDAKFGNAGSHGGYWSCNVLGYHAYCLAFGSNYVSPSDHYPRATAQSVRCQKIQD